MKKRLNLDSLDVKSFKTTYQKVLGGNSDNTEFLQTCTEGDQCPDYTYNRWCYDSDNTRGICTAPK